MLRRDHRHCRDRCQGRRRSTILATRSSECRDPTAMITDPLPVRPAPNVIFQEVEGEAVLLNLDTERYYGLDVVGTRVWQLLVDHGDIDTIIARLLAEFDVAEPVLRGDIMTLLDSLVAAGLIVQHGS